MPERTYRFAPRGKFSLLEGYLRALRSAREFIYLENQFLWSTEIIASWSTSSPIHLEDFRVLLVLPARPDSGADTTRGQLAACCRPTPARAGCSPPQ